VKATLRDSEGVNVAFTDLGAPDPGLPDQRKLGRWELARRLVRGTSCGELR